jgi:hypothetical protein
MKHTVEIVNMGEFERLPDVSETALGRKITLKIDDIVVFGHYLLRKGQKTQRYSVYVLHLSNNVSSHPDWKNLRIQILEALNEENDTMEPLLWRPIPKKSGRNSAE